MFSFLSAVLAEIAATEIPQAAAAASSEVNAVVQTVESAGSGLLTSPQITAAVIAGVVSVLIALLTNRREKRQLFSNIVSRERMEWVRKVRQLCAELCAICALYDADAILGEPEKLLAFHKARSGLLLHLSPWNYYTTDNEMITLLTPLDPEPDAQNTAETAALPYDQNDREKAKRDFQLVKANCPQIRKLLTKICKMEWDKVKIESGSSKSKQRKIDRLQESLKVVAKEEPKQSNQTANKKDA